MRAFLREGILGNEMAFLKMVLSTISLIIIISSSGTFGKIMIIIDPLLYHTTNMYHDFVNYRCGGNVLMFLFASAKLITFNLSDY